MMTKNYPEKLACFTYNWMKKDKRITKEYVKIFLTIACKNFELESYLKNISFTCRNRYEYNPINSSLSFSLKDLLESFLEIGIMYKWDTLERESYEYFYVNEYLLHELEHIHDFKNCFELKENFKIKISRLCFDTEIGYSKAKNPLEQKIWLLKDKEKEKKYQKNYSYSPIERFANLNSIKILIQMAEILELSEIKYYYLYKLYEQMIDNYERKENPTLYYLNQMGYIREANEIRNEMPNLSFEERLNLGLFISKEEQHQLKRSFYKKIPWFNE